MSKLLSTQNRPHIVVILVAIVARAILGGIPLIGGLIGFGLLLVILFHIYKVATNMISSNTANS